MIVAACEQCPCSVFEALDDVFCWHPDAPDGESSLLHSVGGGWRGSDYFPQSWPIPSWCPLRVAPLTIEVGNG